MTKTYKIVFSSKSRGKTGNVVPSLYGVRFKSKAKATKLIKSRLMPEWYSIRKVKG